MTYYGISKYASVSLQYDFVSAQTQYLSLGSLNIAMFYAQSQGPAASDGFKIENNVHFNIAFVTILLFFFTEF